MNSLSLEAAHDSQQRTRATLPPGTQRLVLTGFMGAGKSTVGRLLATHLGWTFFDLDALIEARAGASVPELFDRLGEPRFRRLESSALAGALRQPNTILALGGGAPETLTNRLLLEQTPGTLTVFLDAPFPTLFDRCMLQALNPGPGAVDRPNLRDAGAAEARFHARLPLYRRLAHLTVGTGALSPAEVLPALLSALEKISG